jgi:hypothetical protein
MTLVPSRLTPFVLLLAALAGCPKEVVDPDTGAVDFADPKSVTAHVFHAARTGDTSQLPTLCDPRGQNNDDTRRICGLTQTSPEWPSFVRAFRLAHLNGEPRVSGDQALVDFVYGPDGKASETMELVRRDGRWYLERF